MVNLSFATNVYAALDGKKRFFKLERGDAQEAKKLRASDNKTSFKTLHSYKPESSSFSFSRKDKPQMMGLGRYAALVPHQSTIIEIDAEAEEVLPNNEGLVWPIPENITQRISSPFGYRIHPVTGQYALHKGIDIAASLGSPVRATHNGVIKGVGTHPRLGRYIKIEHSFNEYSLYGHLSDWDVSEGMVVKAGDMIGKVGTSGRSTGPHLDYSLRVDGEAVDPLDYLTMPDVMKTLELSEATR